MTPSPFMMRYLCASVLLLVLSSSRTEGHQARRTLHENRRLTPRLFRTYEETWKSATVGRSYVSTLETSCIKRPSKSGKKSKSSKSGKKSKSSKSGKGGKGGSATISRSFSQDPDISRSFDDEPDISRSFDEDPVIGRSFDEDPVISRSFDEDQVRSSSKSSSGKKSSKGSSRLPFCDDLEGDISSEDYYDDSDENTGDTVSREDNGNTGNSPSGDTGNPPSGDTGTPPSGDTGNPPSGDTGNPPSGDTGNPPAPTPEPFISRDFPPTPAPVSDNSRRTTPEPTVPFIVREEATKCELYFAGLAPTNTDNIPFTAYLTLQTDGSRPMEDILADIHQVLKEQVAPDIMGCSRLAGSRRRSRRHLHAGLQYGHKRRRTQEASEVVNVDFATVTETNPGSSVAQVDGAVYYTGGFPEGILALVRAAIANGDFSNIPGLTSVDSVIVEDSSGNVFGPPPDEVSPDDDSGVDSVRGQDPSQAERTSLSAGGYVGLAVAGLVVGLLVLFASRQRRRRNRDSPGRSLKHEQFHDLEEEASYEDRAATDGDSDEYLSRAETVPDIGERVPASDSSYHIANIVDEASLWENQSRNERFRGGQGLEVHAVEPTHSCSSPTCAVCRDKMEAPITFVTPGEPPRRDTARLSSRGYVASDTVQL